MIYPKNRVQQQIDEKTSSPDERLKRPYCFSWLHFPNWRLQTFGFLVIWLIVELITSKWSWRESFRYVPYRWCGNEPLSSSDDDPPWDSCFESMDIHYPFRAHFYGLFGLGKLVLFILIPFYLFTHLVLSFLGLHDMAEIADGWMFNIGSLILITGYTVFLNSISYAYRYCNYGHHHWDHFVFVILGFIFFNFNVTHLFFRLFVHCFPSQSITIRTLVFLVCLLLSPIAFFVYMNGITLFIVEQLIPSRWEYRDKRISLWIFLSLLCSFGLWIGLMLMFYSKRIILAIRSIIYRQK